MSFATLRSRAKDLLEGQPFTKRDVGILLVAPGFLLFSLFMIFPIAFLIWVSLTDAGHAGTVVSEGTFFFMPPEGTEFVGLDNYVSLMADTQFWNSLGITWLFLAVSLVIKLFVSIGIALVLTHARVVGKRYMRAIIIIPLGFPTIFTITVWRGMFSGARFGVFNELLFRLHLIDQPIGWLSERWMAFSAYVVTEVWLAYPFMAIIIVSALQDVPADLHDAAKVDGAGFMHRFIHVTLPSIRRPVIFASILTAAASFQQFLVPWVFNRGGPGRENQLILVYGYEEAIQIQQYGTASAIMVTAILFIGMFMWLSVKKTNIAEGVKQE